jgi:hypothetical protein
MAHFSPACHKRNGEPDVSSFWTRIPKVLQAISPGTIQESSKPTRLSEEARVAMPVILDRKSEEDELTYDGLSFDR